MLSCPHRPPCSACPRFGEPGIAPAASAKLDALAQRHDLPRPQLICGELIGFRHRARLAIRGRLGNPKIGLFEQGTHRVVHIPHCKVHHPLINRVAGVVRGALVDSQVTSYSEAAHLGVARYLQVVVERSSQTAQVVLVANTPTADPLATCLNTIRDRLGTELHSLWFNSNCERANVILGRSFQRWHGPQSVIERFGGAAVHYPPGAFGQNNLDIAERIIEYVRSRIPAGSRVMEYYAGVGAIGLSLLSKARDLRMNEVSPASLQGLELGMAALDPADRAKVSVIPGPAGIAAAAAALAAVDVIIADPPRKGVDPEVIDSVMRRPPKLLVYISCGIDSLLTDTLRLTEGGTLRLTSLAAFDLLPFTEHVETVACFETAQ